ncbi:MULTISPECIES: hypothetical protein [unclassified Streptomyces]|uniref:hypothetical protein n=1 Tax=unclassified Streptomyces TaxID=2593676 RepID=UPI00380667A5
MRTAVVCALLCAAALPAPPADASHRRAAPAVSVSVAVTDGVDRTEAGERLDYRITVHNLGATAVPGARIEQRMPATTASATASGGRIVGSGTGQQKAVWHTDLPAYDIQVFTATAELGDRTTLGPTAAPGTRRAATTVCVYVPPSDAPTACSGDIDDLPETHPETTGGDGWVWWAVAAAACALFAPGVVRAVRRHRAGTGDRTP